ncbi:myrosinase 1-like [Maniola jurtina]|uniref:myrosinase 1-like n=1 Tax=Maniola jurtina TaxID=191418 RepID=UPI001E685FAE|nr:myrosinase 1-like [Maniola jurtina]
MTPWTALVVWLLTEGAWCASDLKFPAGFKFGAATASYQVEGAWNVSGKTPSIWDTITHTRPHVIADASTGDIACDSYHLWRDDIQIAADLGLDFYRFSLSWPRILPTGFPNYINEDGRRYYDNLINGLLEKGIEPVVTMYHWDMPQRLQNLGGWSNPLMVDWFADYAKVLYQLFGDRVKTWITINEPFTICTVGYAVDAFSSGVKDSEVGRYICIKNVVLAHSKAWRIYDQEFRKEFKGRVGVAHQLFYLDPATKEDEEIAALAHEYFYGLYTHPVFSKDGGWPPGIEKVMAKNSEIQGYPQSRLPAFTDEEKKLAKGAYDFFGFQFYTSRKLRRLKDGESLGTPSPMRNIDELDAIFEVDPSWEQGACFWFYSYPEGMRKALAWVKAQYGDVEVIITENGYSSKGYGLQDYDRIKYYRDHLEQVLLSIREDKVNITGYTAWTLIDNFEWNDGYTTKFGLYEVNFDDPKRPRTPRDSAEYYKEVIKTRSVAAIPQKYIKISDELFSLSWPRILPTGFPNYINEDGRRYYDNLINGLLEKGIEPVVTMYHWDMPQRLHNLGGWSNPLMVDWFADYAKVLYQLFGDRVKTWITINEPFTICTVGYAVEAFSSGVKDSEVGRYICTKNVVLAHSKAWRIYDQEFRKEFKGRIGVAHPLFYLEPATKEDEEIAALAHEYFYGLHTHPVFSKDGGWPPGIEKVMAKNSEIQGYPQSRLPAFTDEEKELAKGAYDFFGFQFYTSRKVRRLKDGESLGTPSPLRNIDELDAIFEVDPSWEQGACFWCYSYPEGMRQALAWVKAQYGDVEVIITENGYSSKGYGLQDYDRIKYYRDHLEQVLLSIREDKVNITGYTAWTLIDNFEWNDGYTTKFGLYEVNFDDPKRPRTPRDSAEYYKEVIKTRTVAYHRNISRSLG